ncbi:MAG TPA: membrane protein insertase YidC [Nocardioidaceae bacterium]|nr:membrane protein insertase YidC [Nocardioidaceae bacterium]
MIEFFKDVGSLIMDPLYFVTSFILTTFHELFSGWFGDGNAAQGWAWALAIVCLTIVIRIVLIPLFVKQIKSSRNMQLLQPKVKELQKKYGQDRERLAQETMKLYRETGTNPFASCLPLILQMPIFLALFRLIDRAATPGFGGEHFLTDTNGEQLQRATIFGARISDQFLGADDLNTQILAIILILTMTATTFLTQRQLMSKNMPADAMSGPYAQQQKMLLYVLPLVFGVGGVAFPIGVVIYWTTSNAWTMCQQFYVIHNNPAPGTPAAKAREERLARKGKATATPAGGSSGGGAGGDGAVAVKEAPRPPQRQQPKKQPRSKRKPGKKK